MAVSDEIATILAQAEVMDDLIDQFRAAAALIAAAETEIRRAQPGRSHEVISGRTRLADFAHARMVAPDISGSASVTQIATDAWSEVQ